MVRMAWLNLCTRPTRFIGAFVALALGVALLAATGLVIWARPPAHGVARFAPTTVVVTVDPVLRSTDPDQPGEVTVAAAGAISDSTVEQLSHGVGVAAAVSDRSCDVQVLAESGPATVEDTVSRGHGWSSATPGPYRLANGRQPSTEGEVVVDGRLAAVAGLRPGAEVLVLTEHDSAPHTVVGVTATIDTSEAVVFFTDQEIRRLCPTVTAVALTPATGISPTTLARSIQASHPGLRALTGDRIRDAEPDPVGDAFEGTVALLSTMSSISGFVAIFVVASTFGLAVTQRRRELALLRTVGATSRQVRRMVLAEAVVLATLAAVAGCLLALPTGELLVRSLRWLSVAPPHLRLRIAAVPLLIAVGVGVMVALLGVWFASRRVRKVRPVEALREATVERSGMTLSRWIFGLLFTGGGVVLVVLGPVSSPETRVSMTIVVGQLLVTGLAALAPRLVPPLVWWIGSPVARALSAVGRHASATIVMTAAAHLRAQPRRAAAAAAPVLVLTGVASGLMIMVATTDASTTREQRAQTPGDLIIVAGLTPGLTDAAVLGASTVDGVATVTPVVSTQVHTISASAVDTIGAVALDSDAINRSVPRLRVLSGRLDDVRGDGFAAGESVAREHGWRLGDEVSLVLDDASPVRVRLVATVDGGLADVSIVLAESIVDQHRAQWSVPYAVVSITPGAALDEVTRALTARLGPLGAAAVGRGAWLASLSAARQKNNRTGLIALLGLAGVYAAVAVVNTVIMATRDRVRDVAQLRLAGATQRQAVAALISEGAIVLAIGLILGSAVATVAAAGLPAALRAISSTAELVIPVGQVGLVAGGCVVLVLVSSAAAGMAAARHRPIDVLGMAD